MVLVDEVATRRAPTLEELKDTLYEQGAADELVFDLALRERSAVSGGGSPPPEPRLRAIAQMFLSWLAQAMKLSDATWFSAVALIDAYSTHIEGGLDARRLAGACVASVRLLQKLNCSALGIPAKSLVECTSNFSDWMRKMGHQCEEVTSEYLDDEERAIVRAMHWQVVIPTLESWLSLYVQRLDLITKGAHKAQLQRARQNSLLCARALVGFAPASEGRRPQRVARGLLGLALAGERLLAVEAADLSPTKEKMERKQEMKVGVPGVQGAFCAATLATWEELRADCAMASSAVREAALAVQANAALGVKPSR